MSTSSCCSPADTTSDTTATSTTPAATSARRESAHAELPRVAPAIDVYEQHGELVLLADVPGLSAQDLELTIERQVLTIAGTARGCQPNGAVLHQEFSAVRYERSVSFSSRIDAARISASVSGGVLRIVVPTLAALQPRRIPVVTSAGAASAA